MVVLASSGHDFQCALKLFVAAFEVGEMCVLLRSVVVTKDLNQRANLMNFSCHIYWHGIWINRTESQTQEAEISFICRVAVLRFKDWERSAWCLWVPDFVILREDCQADSELTKGNILYISSSLEFPWDLLEWAEECHLKGILQVASRFT